MSLNINLQSPQKSYYKQYQQYIAFLSIKNETQCSSSNQGIVDYISIIIESLTGATSYFLLFRSYLQSSQGMHCNAITVVYGFVTVIHPGIAGQWVDELRVFAASNDFSWEASLHDELNSCLSRSSYPPLFPSIQRNPRRPRGDLAHREATLDANQVQPPRESEGISLLCLSN